MKLQVAVDTLDLEQSFILLDAIQWDVDIIEAGTPLLLRYGLQVVREFRQRYPMNYILADTKIMDAGYLEADSCFIAGADCCTVCGAANERTIEETVRASRKYGKDVMADSITCNIGEKFVMKMESLKVDFVCAHTGWDMQGQDDPVRELNLLSSMHHSFHIAVAGGISLTNIDDVVKKHPDVVIVGGAVCNAYHPEVAVRELKEHFL